MDLEHPDEVEHLVQPQLELAAEEPAHVQTAPLLRQAPADFTPTQPRQIDQAAKRLPYALDVRLTCHAGPLRFSGRIAAPLG
jgi:hypothetical protein